MSEKIATGYIMCAIFVVSAVTIYTRCDRMLDMHLGTSNSALASVREPSMNPMSNTSGVKSWRGHLG